MRSHSEAGREGLPTVVAAKVIEGEKMAWPMSCCKSHSIHRTAAAFDLSRGSGWKWLEQVVESTWWNMLERISDLNRINRLPVEATSQGDDAQNLFACRHNTLITLQVAVVFQDNSGRCESSF